MSKQNEQSQPMDSDVQEKPQEANDLMERLNHYQDVAGAIDARFERENEHRNLTLDDMPYGEELIRIGGATESVEYAIEQLEKIETGKISGREACEAFDAATDAIEEACATLEDCKKLPDEESDDDE